MLQTVLQLSEPDRPGVKSNADKLNYYASSIKVDYSKDQSNAVEEIDLYSNTSCGSQ